MTALGLALSAVLAAIAALHLAWAARVWWPVREEAALARTIAGFRGIDRMPGPLACMVVAVAVLACLVLAADLSFAPGLTRLPSWIAATASGIAGTVFLGRGIAGFTPFWARLTPEEPFRTLDRRYYSPLCILLGLGFVTLIWSNWT